MYIVFQGYCAEDGKPTTDVKDLSVSPARYRFYA
jgi:hypothetical protein